MSDDELRSSYYDHQSNGSIERMNQNILMVMKKTLLDARMKNKELDWEEILPMVLLSINTINSSATDCSPVEIVFGRSIKSPFDTCVDVAGSMKNNRYSR